MKKLMYVTMVVTCVALSGCLSSASSFVPAAMPLEPGKFTVVSSEVSGTCTQVQWLFFTFGKAGSPQRHALDDAVGQVPETDTLIAMAVDEEQFAFLSTTLMPIPILPVFTTTRVTGSPVKINAQ